MKKVLTLFFCLIPINILKILLLNSIGHKISIRAKIGINLIITENLLLNNGAKIKHFNFIKIKSLELDENALIKSFNYFKGPISIKLSNNAIISNQNKIRRANAPITYGKSSLCLGDNAIVVSNHFLDLTRSITIGKNSIIAGIKTQIWTHGYYHADSGSERIRIDGEVHIGDNVYIGSSCIFNPGVTVGNAIHIGAGSVISKDLTEKGMYVGQALRYINNNIVNIKEKLTKIEEKGLIETVYTKTNGRN